MTELDVADGDDELVSSALDLPPDADPTIDWGQRAHLDDHGVPRIIERTLTVPPELAGLRLDHFLKTQIPRLSRTRIQVVIASQLTRASGLPLKPATMVAGGDAFTIRRPARAEPPCPRTFAIVHTDPRFYVIDKPAHLPVHASAKFYFNTLTRVLAERLPTEAVQICHRLDRETSGCLVVARDREAAASLKGAFEAKRVRKHYLAVVHGQPPWPDGDADQHSALPVGSAARSGEAGPFDGEVALDHVLDAPLRVAGPDDPTRLPGVRMMTGPGGLPSVTRVHVVRRHGAYALVKCTPVTGRQHQIRAHLADAGYPIVGDKLYAHGDDAFMTACDRGLTPELAALFVLPRHALHAAAITVPHPEDGRPITATAPLPADLARLIGL